MAEVPLDDEGHLRFVLDYLGHELEPSILIGGWATFARVVWGRQRKRDGGYGETEVGGLRVRARGCCGRVAPCQECSRGDFGFRKGF